MNLWQRWRRTRLGPVRDTGDGGPVLVGDVWMDARGRAPQRSWARSAAATWGRRLGLVVGGVARAGGWVLGVESRSGTEKRSITSLPWIEGGPGTSQDVSVDRALRLAPVYAAGRVLASNLAAAELRQYRQVGEATQRLPLSSLFASPSTQGILHDWIWRCVTSMVYRGNAVGLITGRDYLEYPTQVEWLPIDWVQCVDTMPYGPGSFVDPIWYVLGHRVDASELVHIPWFTLPGRVWGLSPIGAFASTVATGLAAQEYTQSWFESGGVPPGTFKNTQQTVDQADAAIIKGRLVDAIRTRQPIVYGKDWDYNSITIPAYEAKFVETLKLTATQLAAIYGLPPEMIGGETGGSMSYSSPEQRQIELVQFALLPWMTKIESHFSMQTPRGQFIKFDADCLIRTDAATRWAIWEKARLIGGMNIDEIRNREDMPPLPNGLGQDYTPLPILAGEKISTPAIRSDGDPPLRVVGGRGQRSG